MCAKFFGWSPEYTLWGIGLGKASEIIGGLLESYGGEKGKQALAGEQLGEMFGGG